MPSLRFEVLGAQVVQVPPDGNCFYYSQAMSAGLLAVDAFDADELGPRSPHDPPLANASWICSVQEILDLAIFSQVCNI